MGHGCMGDNSTGDSDAMEVDAGGIGMTWRSTATQGRAALLMPSRGVGEWGSVRRALVLCMITQDTTAWGRDAQVASAMGPPARTMAS